MWIDYFRTGQAEARIEQALELGALVLPPVVAAELLSAPIKKSERAALMSFLRSLPLHTCPFEHWVRVGELRSLAALKGLALSTPDAHVAQCALDSEAGLLTTDKVFMLLANIAPLKLA